MSAFPFYDMRRIKSALDKYRLSPLHTCVSTMASRTMLTFSCADFSEEVHASAFGCISVGSRSYWKSPNTFSFALPQFSAITAWIRFISQAKHTYNQRYK